MTPTLALPLLTWALLAPAKPAAPVQVAQASGKQAPAAEPAKKAAAPAAPAAKAESIFSLAERIARLQTAVEKDQELLNGLKSDLEDPNGEYQQAQAQFKALDVRLSAARKKAEGILKEGTKTDEAAQAAFDVASLQAEWQAARDRFDLAIEERKIIQSKVAALKQKVQQDQQALDRLTGVTPEAQAAAPNKGQRGDRQGREGRGEGRQGETGKAAGQEPAKTAEEQQLSKEVLQARELVKAKQDAAREARDKARSITERLDAVRKNIELEQRLLENIRKRADQVQEGQAALQRELDRKLADKAPEEEVLKLRDRIADAEQRLGKARGEQLASTDRLRDLQTEVAAIQAEQIQALREADEKRAEAENAQKQLEGLLDPFRFANLVQWAARHGPKVLLILAGIFVLARVVRLTSRRLVQLIALRTGRGTPEEAEARAQTLMGVFRSAAAFVIYGGGLLMLLDEIGIPIVPLLGGAAVAGLAVAFGAQNLIRDYFTGFMVLLEDQYGIDDVVKIGDVSGTVEKITLRMTVLRDMAGVVHFVPHGTIQRVSNMTHGWSRAHFEIGVAYKEDPDRVMEVLLDLGRELRRDEEFAPLILDDPEMQGVDSLEDTGVVIKFFIKTRPLKQWPVKREMLRRIKRRFDEMGITFPYPHWAAYPKPEAQPPDHLQHGGGNAAA